MNFLGHACLSFDNLDILTGNMISDYVKGRSQYQYPPDIQKGIQLHRAIDTFTDTNISVKSIANYFKPVYRLYAPAIADVVLDYFLANDKEEFASVNELKLFTETTYKNLELNQKYFPLKFASMFPYMQSQNWLYNYQFNWGIKKSMEGLKHRALYLTEMDTAFQVFTENKPAIKLLYNDFYPSVKTFAADKMQDLLNT